MHLLAQVIKVLAMLHLRLMAMSLHVLILSMLLVHSGLIFGVSVLCLPIALLVYLVLWFLYRVTNFLKVLLTSRSAMLLLHLLSTRYPITLNIVVLIAMPTVLSMLLLLTLL